MTGASVFSATLWVSGSRVVVRLLGLVSTVIVARLLTPEDFGLVAIAASLVALIEMLTQFSFNQSIIYHKKVTEEDLASAFTLNLCRGLFIGATILALSWPLSVGYDDPRLLPILCATAVIPLISAFENTRFVLFEKDLQFSWLFWFSTLSKVLSVIVTVSLAFIWANYWVLIVGMIVSPLFQTIFTYLVCKPVSSLTFRSWRKLFSFSGWLFVNDFLGAINSKADPLILSTLFPARIVGSLHVAREFSNMLGEVSAPLRRVLFPALSGLDISDDKFLQLYRLAVSTLFMILTPIAVAIALLAPTLIPVLLGEQWREAVPFIQLFMLTSTIITVSKLSQSAIMAAGKPKLIFYRSLVITPVRLALIVSLSSWLGVSGFMLAIAINAPFMALLNMALMGRVFAFGIFAHYVLIIRFIPSLVVMGAVIYSISAEFAAVEHIPYQILGLVVCGIAGALTYVVAVYGIWFLRKKPAGPERLLLTKLNHVAPTGIVQKILKE